jgi:hypothetical protein
MSFSAHRLAKRAEMFEEKVGAQDRVVRAELALVIQLPIRERGNRAIWHGKGYIAHRIGCLRHLQPFHRFGLKRAEAGDRG